MTTLPSQLNRLPWQGQSQLFSAGFQWTMHLRCVQTGEQSVTLPSASR